MSETGGTHTETQLPLDLTVEVLKAIGEPSRLRIIAVLRHGECSVSDLCEILGQSQPRISRHLRLLVEAGVCTRHREGSFVFFGLQRRATAEESYAELTQAILRSLDVSDPQLASDKNVSGRFANAEQPLLRSTLPRSQMRGTEKAHTTLPKRLSRPPSFQPSTHAWAPQILGTSSISALEQAA